MNSNKEYYEKALSSLLNIEFFNSQINLRLYKDIGLFQSLHE